LQNETSTHIVSTKSKEGREEVEEEEGREDGVDTRIWIILYIHRPLSRRRGSREKTKCLLMYSFPTHLFLDEQRHARDQHILHCHRHANTRRQHRGRQRYVPPSLSPSLPFFLCLLVEKLTSPSLPPSLPPFLFSHNTQPQETSPKTATPSLLQPLKKKSDNGNNNKNNNNNQNQKSKFSPRALPKAP